MQRQTRVVLTDDQVCVETPWLQGQIEEMLIERGASAKSLEELWGISLEELWNKAERGEVSFGVCKSSSRFLIFKDVVFLRIVSSRTQAVLVQVTDEGGQWPTTQRLLHESVWCAARRLTRQQLGLEDASLHISVRALPLAGKTMPQGILERRWITTAMVPESLEHLCNDIHAAEL